MKIKHTLILSVGMLVSANAATFIGLDTTTVANWRTAAALEADNEYGTDGYVVYGLNVGESIYSAPHDATTGNFAFEHLISLPGYIADIVLTNPTNHWSGNGNFGQMENPENGNALESTPLLAGVVSQTFTISRSSSSAFRLTLMLADGDSTGSNYTGSVNDGISANIDATPHVADGLRYQTFEVAAGSADVVVTLGSSTDNFSLTGFAFDASQVPEPSSLALLGLGAGALLFRRRK